MRERLLWLDVETGGLDENTHSLLSVGLALWEDGEITPLDEILLKGEYNVTESAMKINGLDLNYLDVHGLDSLTAVSRIVFLVNTFFGNKATIAGHNVGFDIRFLKVLFAKAGIPFDDYFSYRSVDLHSCMKMVAIKEGITLNSLDDAIKHYGMTCEGRHTAMADAIVEAEIFNKLTNKTNGGIKND